jgi:magnesium transporter
LPENVEISSAAATEEVDLRDVADDLAFLAEAGEEQKIRTIVLSSHPADLADVIRYLKEPYRSYVFSLLDAEPASEVLTHLDEVTREQLVKEISHERLTELVDEMDSDDATDIVSELPPEVADRVLEEIDVEDSAEVKELLRHEEDSAGGIMQLEYIAVRADETVDEAIQEIRSKAEEVEEVYNVYVTDEDGRLVGVLPLKQLVLARPGAKVAEVMDRSVISVNAEMDQEEVAQIVRKYDLVTVPVVDDQGRLIGRITVDDVIDVIQEEATEDISRLAGITEEEPRETSAIRISRARLPWLITGIIGELFNAFLMSHFEASLQRMIALAFFVPVIIATGGNIGIQSSAIVVRGLATGEIDLRQTGGRLWRELRVAILNGLVCAAFLFAIVAVWRDTLVAAIIGVSMLMVILVAAVVGATIPLLLKRVNIDPALATGPFITTSNDLIGLLIYLGTATIVLQTG